MQFVEIIYLVLENMVRKLEFLFWWKHEQGKSVNIGVAYMNICNYY